MNVMSTVANWPGPSVPPPAEIEHPSFRPELRAPRVRRAIVAVLGAGVVGALVGIDRPARSFAAVIVILAVTAAVARATLLPRSGRVLLAAGVIAFAPWLALRSSPWLLVPDVIAAMVLVALALSTRNGAGIADSLGGYVHRSGRLVIGAIETPSHVHLGLKSALPQKSRVSIRRTVVPLVTGVSAAAIVALVLASGDALFASYLEFDGFAESTVGRFLGAALAMAAVALATGAALSAGDGPPIPARRLATPRSAIVAMVPLCAVYLAYVAVQASSVALGADYVLSRTGLTFAEYARSGFFQLVAVALATFVGVLSLRPTLRGAPRRERSVLIGLAATATASTVVMAVAAIVKLQLYADVFGLTMLRLHTTVFAGWLVVAMLIAFVSLMRPNREWVLPWVAATALLGVLGMNFVNPERLVAEHNLSATITSDEFDVSYLASLSADAVPTLVSQLGALDPTDRELAIDAICRTPTETSQGLHWNRSAVRAANAREEVC